MSCGVISDSFFITPGLRCAPSLSAKALRPAAVNPPFGSFSRAFDLVLRLRDDFLAVARWLALLGSNAYDIAIWFNTYFNRLRRAAGLTYWSLSKWAKMKVKNAMAFIAEYERTLTAEARRRGSVDGGICGHIHHAVIRDDLGLRYINCGDWVESCTAVIENFDGEFEIIRWTELQPGLSEQDFPAVALPRAM